MTTMRGINSDTKIDTTTTPLQSAQELSFRENAKKKKLQLKASNKTIYIDRTSIFVNIF